MNKVLKSSIIGIAIASNILYLNGCNTKQVESNQVVETEVPTAEPEYFKGNIKKVIEELDVIKGTTVYDNLSVTGRKLGNMDIYLDKNEDKYVVICGQSLVYIPIDKDGVVKLKDGVFKYFNESRNSFTYVIVGKEVKKFEKKSGEFINDEGNINLIINDYKCPDVNVWYGEDGETIMFDLKSLCNSLEIKYDDNVKSCKIKALNNKFVIDIDESSKVSYNNELLDCNDVEYMEDGCLVGIDFLERVLGMDVRVEGNNVYLSGTIIPHIMMIDNYTATGALKKPYSGNKKGISILKIFGDYNQESEISSGEVSHQLYIK